MQSDTPARCSAVQKLTGKVSFLLYTPKGFLELAHEASEN